MRSQMTRLQRWTLSTILFFTTCCSHGPHNEVIALNTARISPSPTWQLVADRAIGCAKAVHADSSSYTMIHDSVDVDSLVWIAVATEQPDGGFPCRKPDGSVSSCVGQFRAPDSVLISSQRLNAREVIAHEILHWAVESAGEKNWGTHGPPWGLCDYF